MAGSSQELEPDELAALMARKATEDAVALREFATNTEIADTVLGFHALCGYPHNACYADLCVMPTRGWKAAPQVVIAPTGSA